MKKVIGLDNAVLEYYLEKGCSKFFGLKEGNANQCNWNKIDSICGSINKEELIIGGSVINVLHGLSLLDVETSLMGVVGYDEEGELFEKKLKELSIKSYLAHEDSRTGLVVTLLCKHGERTFMFNNGTSDKCTPYHLPLGKIKKNNIFHLSAYTLLSDCAREASETAMKEAKRSGLIVSFDLASASIVTEFKNYIEYILEEYVNIVFANEEEAKAFADKPPHLALDKLVNGLKIAVVKVGEFGSYIKESWMGEGSCIIVNPMPTHRFCNTNGAGDAYAAGFLYGILQDYHKKSPLGVNVCGKLGSLLASYVIAEEDPRISFDNKESLLKEIKFLVSKYE